MKFNKIWIVFRKETLEMLRDRRSLAAMILIPIVLYPMMFIIMSQIIAFGGFDFSQQSSAPAAPATGLAAVTISSERDVPSNQSALSTPPPKPEMGQWSTSAETGVGGMIFSSLVPVLIIVTLIFGALYPAIDLTAGEKERGTLETILTVPIKRVELILGKYLTVATFALLTGVLNLVAMMMTYSLGLTQMNALTGNFQFSISPVAMMLLFFTLIPLSLFISSAMISVTIFARTFKEAQNLVTPLYLLLVFPALFALAPAMKLSSALSFIPILNVSLLVKEMMIGSAPAGLIFSVFLSNALCAFVGIVVVAKLFNAEEVLFTEGRAWQFLLRRSQIIRSDVFTPSSALIIFAIIAFLLFYIGSTLQTRFGHWGILATQWLLIFLPILIFIWYNKVDARATLSLKRFHPLAFIGTVMVALAGAAVTTWVARIQIALFPESIKIGEMLVKLLNFDSLGLSAWQGMAIFVLSPAICEELLFRGVILSSLKKRFSPVAAMAIVALLFGIFHLYLFRMIPTAILGFYLAFIVHRTGSIFLGMVGHAVNNGLALLVIANPTARSIYGVIAGEGAYFPVVVLAVIAVLALGISLISTFDGTAKTASSSPS
ncbi:MAG: ABC transporter permease subunit/CPBP intramembrane protease [Candidatus Zhuqueibacterota bacterium]